MSPLAWVLFAFRATRARLAILVLAATWSVLSFIAVCLKDQERRKFVLELGERFESMIERVGEASKPEPAQMQPTNPELDAGEDPADVAELEAGEQAVKSSPKSRPRRRSAP